MIQDSRSRLDVWHEARVKAGASCSTTGRRESIMHHMGEPLLLGSAHCKNTRNPLFRLPPERPWVTFLIPRFTGHLFRSTCESSVPGQAPSTKTRKRVAMTSK